MHPLSTFVWVGAASTLGACVAAAPSAQETGTVSGRKAVAIELPDREPQRRGLRHHEMFDINKAEADLVRTSNKMAKSKESFAKFAGTRSHSANPSQKRKRSTSVREPFDVAGAHLRKRQNAQATESLTDNVVGGTDNVYFGEAQIGTPGQRLTINFDTGSADLWVPGPQASTTAHSSQADEDGELPPLGEGGSTTVSHKAFQTGDSSSYEGSEIPWDIRYGTGEAEGYLASDTVTIAGLTVENTTFAVTNSTAQAFIDVPFDGLMGMGFSQIAQSGAKTFFEHLVEEDQLESNVFSFSLARGSSGVRDGGDEKVAGGTMILGGYDSSQFSGDIKYQDVTVEGYWETRFNGIAVDGTVVNDTEASVAWDTGTTLAYVPPSVMEALAEELGAERAESISSSSSGDYYTVPCSSLDSGLNVSISFGGTLFAWQDEDLDGGYLDEGGNNCVLNIIGSSTSDNHGDELAIIGDTFLKNVVAIFDLSDSDNPRVGMASSNSSVTESSIASNDSSSAVALTCSLSFLSTMLGMAYMALL